MRFHSPTIFVLAACSLTLLAACKEDDPDSPPEVTVTVEPFVAETPLALQIQGAYGCVLDIDCADNMHCFQSVCATECSGDEDCAERTRCVSPVDAKDLDGGYFAAAHDVLPGYRFEALPARDQRVADGTETLRLTAVLNQPAPPEGVRYRLESEPVIELPVVSRTEGGSTEITFEVPVGALEPEQFPVEIGIISSVGVLRVTLVRTPSVAGEYLGEASISTLGGMKVPMRMWVVTDPVEASLEDAERAWMLLPVGADEIFSPHEVIAGRPWVASELEFDGFVERWVGRFDNTFHFGAESFLPSYSADQVGRTMRFEIEPLGADRFTGAFVDRWEGLYETRTLDGLRQLEVVRLEGEFEVSRVGVGPGPDEIVAAAGDAANPGPLPNPSLDRCQNADFAVTPIRVGEVSYGCGDITSVAAFEVASDEDRANCAIAVAETALAGSTVSGQIRDFLDGDEQTPGGQSFAEFMEACAAGVGGACRPSEVVLCSRQLTAYAFSIPETEVTTSAQLVLSFQNATREAYLGRQLGAFQTDSVTRLAWLRASDFPAIVTSALQSHTAGLLQDWVDNVLDVHLDVLSGQVDIAGLAVMSREPRGEDSVVARQQLLLEMSQSWRGAMEALTLASRRWHTLYQGDRERAEAAEEVSVRAFDLYVIAGVLANLNREAGVGYANATFGGGFGQLVRSNRMLRQPFSSLIYARDAEVVVSTSLDPESGANSILRERQALAESELQAADVAVSTILTTADARALDESQLRNRLNNEISDLRADLVDLCGLPIGCTVADYGVVAECEVRVDPGECGFLIDRFTRNFAQFDGAQNVSEAGRELMSVRDAALAFAIAEEELRSHVSEVQRAIATTDAFAESVAQWDERRRAALDEIVTLTNNAEAIADTTITELLTGVNVRARLRSELITDRRASVADWSAIRVAGAQSDFRSLVAQTALEQSASGQREAGQTVTETASAIAEGLPTSTGLSNDVFAPARMGIMLGGALASATLRFEALRFESFATRMENARERDQALRTAELTRLEQEGDIDDQEALDEITQLAEQAQARTTAAQFELLQINRLIEVVREQVQADLAFQRDLVELRDRRDAVATLIGQTTPLEIRLIQAEYDIQRSVNQYLQVAQTGQLQGARLADLESQRQSVSLMLGSPSVVFRRAAELVRAEARLNRAKDALMNWLVAMEYFAVRPFMDQRIQILLASNTNQLEAIAAEMERLEGVCGGLTNQETSEVSLVELLDLGSAVVDGNGVEFESGERLRATLRRGAVPVDKRVRFRTDANVGGLMGRSDIQAATFALSLDDFSNLGSTCNARALTLEVQLVGEGLGEGQPTVNILYDGNSQLRSCQPGFASYVAQFGTTSTAFGEITTFESPGRSVAPVAGINAFREGSVNQSLAGLPLSASYTLLIDPSAGENRNINWDRLEDIRLRIGYVYQDVFPAGTCE